VKIEHDDGNISVDLDTGLYSPNGFINEFVSKVNAALLALPSGDTISGIYNASQRKFVFTSSAGNDWMFDHACNLLTRGDYFVPFKAYASGTLGTNGSTSWTSGIAAMLYTRYITVNSRAMSQYVTSNSATTDPTQPSNIICLVDISEIYNPEDFVVSQQFSTNIRSIETPHAPVINVANTKKNVSRLIDISVYDEWNISLNQAYDNNDNSPNRMGIALFCNVFF
jgi:hypothetical protein